MTPVALVLVAWGCWQCIVLVDDATHRPTASTKGLHLYNGTFGQRTLVAAYLALTLPLVSLIGREAPIIGWAILAAYVWGLGITSSWLALIAGIVGCGWLVPASLWVTGPVLLAGAASLGWAEWRHAHGGARIAPGLAWTTRSDSIDTIKCRLLTWAIMLAHLRALLPFGRGPGETVRDLLRWDSRYKLTLIHGYAHNEPLQLMYEHGVLGAAAIACLVWRIAPHLVVGDPWSAATLTGAVLACGTIVCRVAPLGMAWLVIAAVAVSR